MFVTQTQNVGKRWEITAEHCPPSSSVSLFAFATPLQHHIQNISISTEFQFYKEYFSVREDSEIFLLFIILFIFPDMIPPIRGLTSFDSTVRADPVIHQ